MTESKLEIAIQALRSDLGEQRFHYFVQKLKEFEQGRVLFWQEEVLERIEANNGVLLPRDIVLLKALLLPKTNLAGIKSRFFETLKKDLAPQLRELGFKGSGRHFRRIRVEVMNVVSIQTDKYGESVSIGLGLHPSFMPKFGIGPPPSPTKFKEYDCQFRSSVFSPQVSKGDWKFLSHDSPEQAAASLNEACLTNGESQFKQYDTIEKIAAMYSGDRVHVGDWSFRESGHTIHTCLSMAWVNLHLGRFKLASEFGQLGFAQVGQASLFDPYFEEIVRCCQNRSTEPGPIQLDFDDTDDDVAG